MNAGAYGGDIAGVLVRAQVVAADAGPSWRTPEELDPPTAARRSGTGEVVTRAEFRLSRRDPAEIRGETVAGMQARRKAAQPTNRRTFGSVSG